MKMTRVKDLFDVKYGNSLELVNLEACDQLFPGAVSFVSRTEKNNGVSAVVKRLPELEPFEDGLITVAASGNSVLESFVQITPFYTGFHVFILRPRNKLSVLEKLFYCYCIRKNQYKYNFGRQANKTLKEILIPEKMPTSWQQLDIKKLNNLNNKSLKDETITLNTLDWEYFNLDDFFVISASRDELIDMLTEGGRTPYVTSSDVNNGITSYVKEEPTNLAGTITANRGGSVGCFFFQPADYKATPVDVRILTPKFKMNTYVGLFLRTVLQLNYHGLTSVDS